MPSALALGLNEEAFWNSNPSDISIYVKAERIQLKNQNFMMYVQGAYIYQGVSIAIANAFSQGKKYKYLKEPFKLFQDEDEQEANKDVEMLKLKTFLNMLERRVNK